MEGFRRAIHRDSDFFALAALNRNSLLGSAMILAAATVFATAPILAKIAYETGLTTVELLAGRFLLAAVGMTVIAILAGQNPLAIPRARLGGLLAMGGVLYSAQSFGYFIALKYLPASLVTLTLYLYPTLVFLATWFLYRRKVSALHQVALVASFVGVGLVIGGAKLELSWALVFAIASPVVYTLYLLAAEHLMAVTPPLAASATIMAGAAIAFCIVAVTTGQVAELPTVAGWVVIAAFAIGPTMLAISLFLVGLRWIGVERAALLSTWEPVVIVALAAVLLGERLSWAQVLGALLVLGTVILINRKRPVLSAATVVDNTLSTRS